VLNPVRRDIDRNETITGSFVSVKADPFHAK
jgi:hypothetical protein